MEKVKVAVFIGSASDEATVALDKAGARNAAWLAAQILALHDPELAHQIRISRERFKSDVAVAGAEIEAKYC